MGKVWRYAAPVVALVWRQTPSGLQVPITRMLAPTFLVGVSAVCLNEHHQALLVEHRFAKRRQRWGLPGGLMGRGETPREGLQREVLEETGLSVGNLEPVLIDSLDSHLHLVFMCWIDQAPSRLQQEELSDWRWADPATIDLPMLPHHRQALRLVGDLHRV